jgi:hypothetical protein
VSAGGGVLDLHDGSRWGASAARGAAPGPGSRPGSMPGRFLDLERTKPPVSDSGRVRHPGFFRNRLRCNEYRVNHSAAVAAAPSPGPVWKRGARTGRMDEWGRVHRGRMGGMRRGSVAGEPPYRAPPTRETFAPRPHGDASAGKRMRGSHLRSVHGAGAPCGGCVRAKQVAPRETAVPARAAEGGASCRSHGRPGAPGAGRAPPPAQRGAAWTSPESTT